jgi:dienelactone hydrolase
VAGPTSPPSCPDDAFPDEPLGAWLRERPGADGVRSFAFEYTSRGDRVPGRLLLPREPGGRRPLVLLQHGAGGSKDAPYLDAVRLPWVRAGAAVATVDFPLHGERTNAKLSQLLLAALRPSGAAASDAATRLWTGFVQQGVTDLHRALDALAEHPEIDVGRAGYAGLSLGTVIGSLFCAEDARVRAAALAIGGGGRGPAALDPASHVGRIAPRPVLFVNALRDATIPRSAAEALHAAAREPKQVLWFDCTHAELPGAALKAMWTFLREHLRAP